MTTLHENPNDYLLSSEEINKMTDEILFPSLWTRAKESARRVVYSPVFASSVAGGVVGTLTILALQATYAPENIQTDTAPRGLLARTCAVMPNEGLAADLYQRFCGEGVEVVSETPAPAKPVARMIYPSPVSLDGVRKF